jgi:hypothetical protein
MLKMLAMKIAKTIHILFLMFYFLLCFKVRVLAAIAFFLTFSSSR